MKHTPGRRQNTTPGETVDVWRLELPEGAAQHDSLAPDETARAERIRSPLVRSRWIMVRSGLRAILGKYAGREPRGLRFRYGTHGKPALLLEQGDPDLRFNVSHSRTLALIAVAVGREVGVDVELVRDGRKINALAARILSPYEQAAFRALPPELRLRAFYLAWSRKEAFVKARGDALWLTARSFDVSLDPRRPARLLDTRPDPREAARWMLSDIDAGEQYVAALACEGPPCPVIVKQWDAAVSAQPSGLLHQRGG